MLILYYSGATGQNVLFYRSISIELVSLNNYTNHQFNYCVVYVVINFIY